MKLLCLILTIFISNFYLAGLIHNHHECSLQHKDNCNLCLIFNGTKNFIITNTNLTINIIFLVFISIFSYIILIPKLTNKIYLRAPPF